MAGQVHPTLRLGSRGAAVKDMQQRLIAKHFGVGSSGADGIFGSHTDTAVRNFQAAHHLHIDGICGPNTWEALLASQPPPHGPPAHGTGRALAALAYKVVTAGFGHPVYYRWGARVSGLDLHHPATWTHMDCSEFTQGCATVHTGHEWHDGAANQYNHCNHIGVSKAIGTPGALLFIYGHVMGHPNPYIHHVAVSLGDGRTAEFRSRKMGAGVWSAHGRFTHAGLIPGIHY